MTDHTLAEIPHDQLERARVNEAYERASLRENRRDPIAQYYVDCREKAHAAYLVWKQAKEAGADAKELRRLWEAYIDAGNTGG